MTRTQQTVLHALLRDTETEFSKGGLPLCSDEQMAQRRGIIAAWEEKRRIDSRLRKEGDGVALLRAQINRAESNMPPVVVSPSSGDYIIKHLGQGR